MAIAQHVHRRGGIYHLRCRVPTDLVTIIGRVEIRRSLGTSCPKQARYRAPKLYALVRALFDTVKGMDDPKDAQIRELFEMLEEALGWVHDQQISVESLTDALEQERDLRKQAMRAFAKLKGDYAAVLHETLSQDEALKVRLAAASGQLQKLKVSVAEHEEDYRLLQRDINVGKAADTVSFLRGMMGDMGFRVNTKITPKVSDFLAKEYEQERKLQDDARRHILNYVTLFSRITDDRCLSEYTRTDIVNYVRTLELLKNSLGKSPSDKNKTISQILDESKDKPTMNVTTIEKHIGHVKAFFVTANKHIRFATTDDINDLFDDIDFSDHVPLPEKRKRWSMEQLNELFSSPIWQGTGSAPDAWSKRNMSGRNVYRDAYWWLPVVALWTGARLEEIAQLHHDDLRRDVNGVAFLHINDEGDRRLKTKNSIRNVPVHSVLIDLGFLQLFDPTKHGERIWPELQPTGRLKKLGDTFSSHFTDYRRRCGLYEKLRDFHSLRRTFITTMRTRIKVDWLTVAAMCGHDEEIPEYERAEQTEGYTDYDVGPLKEELERLDYAALGLKVDLLRSLRSSS